MKCCFTQPAGFQYLFATVKKGEKKHPEFERKSCRCCGYWMTRPDDERCPNCATFHPLQGRHRYGRGRLLRRVITGGVAGGLAGASAGIFTSWLAGKGLSVAGLPLVTLTSGIFGAGLAKCMFRFSERAAVMSLGVVCGAGAALLYPQASPIGLLLWIAGGAWAGHRFLYDTLYAVPRQRLMELEKEIFHEKVLARTSERKQAIADKLHALRKIKSDLHQRKNEAEQESMRTLKEAEKTLIQSLESYEQLRVKTELHLLENKLRKWKDNLFEVSNANESMYRKRLAAIADRFQCFAMDLKRNKEVSAVVREELIEHTRRASNAVSKLEVELTKWSILSETRNVSAVPDAHLTDETLLAPNSQTGDFSYEDLDAELVNYDVFNELEEEYVRLKVERELPLADEQ